MLRNDFVRHGALVFAATMLGNVLNYAFNFAISRRLGVEGFAELSSLMSGLMLTSIPANIINLVVVKYTAEFHAAGDEAKLARFSRTLMKWTAAAGALVLFAGLFARAGAAAFLHVTNDAAIPLSIAVIAFSFVMPSVRGVLQGEQDFRRFSISSLVEAGLKVALGVAFVYSGYGVTGAMAGWLCGTGMALLYTVWAVRRHHPKAPVGIRLSLDVPRLFRTTAGVALATAAMTVLGFTDVLLVKHFFDAHQAGLYAAANLTGKIVLFLVSFLPMVVLPKAVAAARRGQPSTRLFLQAVTGTVLMSGATLAAFSMNPAAIIRIVAGAAFVGAAPYVAQYDTAMVLLACLTLIVNYKIGLHRFDFVAPLLVIVACEIGAIALFHQTLWDVVHIVLLGNAAAVAACSYRISVPVLSGASKSVSQAA